MSEIMVLVGITVIIFSAFLALYIWTRRSESSISYEHPGLTDREGDALRFGIAMAANTKNSQ